MIAGEINIRVAMSFTSSRPRLSLVFIATNESGNKNRARCPAPASKADEAKQETTESTGG
jgi:hypothetical protein